MSVNLGRFQVMESQSWNGFTTKNHLASIYNASPQKASNILTRLLAINYAPTLDTLLDKFPKKYFDTEDEFTWDLAGSMERNYALVEARYQGSVVTADTNNVGAGKSEFEVVFAEKAFSDVNVIVGEKNEIYQIRILEDPEPELGQYVYKVQLMGDASNGMPGSELVGGKRFSKDFSLVEDTMSIKGGDIGFTSSIGMRNEFSSIRMQHTAPGNMKSVPVKLPFEVKTDKGSKMSSTWMEHVEWKFEWEFNREKSKVLMFARSNRSQDGDYYDIGKSGFVIKQGSGIREQMEVAGTEYYNEFSIKLLTNSLTELSEGKLSMDDRHFVLRTGERGATQFSEAAKAEVSGWLPLGFDNTGTNAIYKTSSNLHQNAYGAGIQFVEWLAPNGVKVTLEVDPFYDDPVRNKVLHPKGGVAESYRYDIMYIGKLDGGEPNIQKAYVRGNEDIRKWEYGIRNPFPSAPEFAIVSNAVDGSTYHRACFGIGAIVRDPSRTKSLIPSILAA